MKMTDSELKTWQLKLQNKQKNKNKTTVKHRCLPVWGSVISFCERDGLFPPGIDGNNLSIVSLLPW